MAGEDVETRGGEVAGRRMTMFTCVLYLCMYVCLFMLNQSPSL
jgi:hypothetical protein